MERADEVAHSCNGTCPRASGPVQNRHWDKSVSLPDVLGMLAPANSPYPGIVCLLHQLKDPHQRHFLVGQGDRLPVTWGGADNPVGLLMSRSSDPPSMVSKNRDLDRN